MNADAVGLARKCARCGHVIAPRDGRPARFCAVCGHAFEGGGFDHGSVPVQRPAPPAAAASLFLALLSLIPMCGLPLGLVAIGLGISAQRQIERSDRPMAGGGMAVAGYTLGAITTIIWLLVCLGAR